MQGQSTFTGDQVLENFEITTSDQVRDPLVLLALTVAFRLSVLSLSLSLFLSRLIAC